LIVGREQGDHSRAPDAPRKNCVCKVTHNVVTLQRSQFITSQFSVQYRLDMGYAYLEWFGPGCFASCRDKPCPFGADVGVVEVGKVVALPEIPFHQHFDGVGPSFQAVAYKESSRLSGLFYSWKLFNVLDLD